MVVKSLYLKNFRNYTQELINFKKNVNIFIGNNAQGKTNVLEALYFFACQKSFRGTKNKDLIQWNSEFLEIVLEFEDENREQRIVNRIFREKNKESYLNGVKQRRTVDMIGMYHAVLFAPEHLNLIKEGPKERRKPIDLALSQIDKQYFAALLEYKKTQEQKNFYLKHNHPIDKNLLEVWNDKLSNLIYYIMKERTQFVKEMSRLAQEKHFEISQNKEQLEIVYQPNIKEENLTQQSIYNYLNSMMKKEIQMKACLSGPHRDDIEFLINEKSAKHFASQGQQRSAILSMKLAECNIFKQRCGHYPSLLLDDIMSELDKGRQTYIIKNIHEIQLFITCCDEDNINGFENGKRFFVENGTIKEI